MKQLKNDRYVDNSQDPYNPFDVLVAGVVEKSWYSIRRIDSV
jgi:hypothetical protein